jgi:hypothetical protein
VGGGYSSGPMPRAVFIVSLLSAAFFAVSFGLTFGARSYVIRHAREYVVVRTEGYATRAVEVAEQGLRVPGARRLMGEERARRVEEEIAEYREGPRAYVERLVGTRPLTAPGSRWGNAGVAAAGALKEGIRAYADGTLRRLLRDVRIFTGTNVVASVMAAALAYRWRRRPDAGAAAADESRVRAREVDLAWVGALLLTSVTVNSYQYVNHMTYFRILTNAFLGWWYAAFVAFMFVWLGSRYGRR